MQNKNAYSGEYKSKLVIEVLEGGVNCPPKNRHKNAPTLKIGIENATPGNRCNKKSQSVDSKVEAWTQKMPCKSS